MNLLKPYRIFIILFSLLILAIGLTYCKRETNPSPFPKNVAGLSLIIYSQGKDAIKDINKLHGKEIPIKNGYVLQYKSNGKKATIWISDSGSKEEANFLLSQMAQRLKMDSKLFGHFLETEIKGSIIYSVLGMGQRHFFFQKDIRLFWIAVDFQIANLFLNEFLEKSKKKLKKAKVR